MIHRFPREYLTYARGCLGFLLVQSIAQKIFATLLDGQSVNQLPGIRASNFVSSVSFAGRAVILYLLLSAILWGIARAYFVRRAGWFLALVGGYVFLYCLVYYPQIYAEAPWIMPGVEWAAVRLDHHWVWGVAGIWMALLAVSWARAIARRQTSLLSFGSWARLAGLLALLYYFVVIQDVNFNEFDHRSPKALNVQTQNSPNIILIGVDTLLPDAFSGTEAPRPEGPVRSFVETAQRYRRVISPVGRTYPAYTTIFTGKNPYETGVRDNLMESSSRSDEILRDSYLTRLKSAGYHVSFELDRDRWVPFTKGPVFDEAYAPGPIISNFDERFRDKVFYALFANRLGYWLFPETRANAGVTFAYQGKSFTRQVIDHLDRWRQEGRPFFAVVHTLRLHFPGYYHYPYYPRDRDADQGILKGCEKFGYRYNPPGESMIASTCSAKGRFRQQAWVNRWGLQEVTEQFLNPVFRYLEESGLTRNSIVVLFSDHSESFWEQKSSTSARDPVHGALLLGEDHSNHSFLAWKYPGMPESEQKVFERTLALKDLLPTILSKAGLASFVPESRLATRTTTYSETAWANRAMVPGQFYYEAFNRDSNRIDPQSGRLVVNSRYEDYLMFSKQRAVSDAQYRLTLYPSEGGYRLDLCDYEADRACRVNLLSEKPDVVERLWRELKFDVTSDVQQGWLPSLDLVRERGKLRLQWSAPSDKVLMAAGAPPWLSVARLSSMLFVDRDGTSATRLLRALTDDEKAPAFPKAWAAGIYLYACRYLPLGQIPEARDFLSRDLSPWLRELTPWEAQAVRNAQVGCREGKPVPDIEAGERSMFRGLFSIVNRWPYDEVKVADLEELDDDEGVNVRHQLRRLMRHRGYLRYKVQLVPLAMGELGEVAEEDEEFDRLLKAIREVCEPALGWGAIEDAYACFSGRWKVLEHSANPRRFSAQLRKDLVSYPLPLRYLYTTLIPDFDARLENAQVPSEIRMANIQRFYATHPDANGAEAAAAERLLGLAILDWSNSGKPLRESVLHFLRGKGLPRVFREWASSLHD